MFKQWPLGQMPKECQRPEYDLHSEPGYTGSDRHDIVEQFLQKVANFSGDNHGY